jgi:hypothetical protein
VLFLGISGPEKHIFVFRFSQDAPPQMTQWTSSLCLCVGGQEIPEVSYPTDLYSGYKTSVRGIGSKWPNMGLARSDYRGFHFCRSLRSKSSRPTALSLPGAQLDVHSLTAPHRHKVRNLCTTSLFWLAEGEELGSFFGFF